jgi:glutamyl-tRNA synthetase
MATNKQLADMIFPDVTGTIEDLDKRFPKRTLPEGAEVTRFAPSPTGFLHTGSGTFQYRR